MLGGGSRWQLLHDTMHENHIALSAYSCMGGLAYLTIRGGNLRACTRGQLCACAGLEADLHTKAHTMLIGGQIPPPVLSGRV